MAAFHLLALTATSCTKETAETKRDGDTYLNYGVAAGKQTPGTRAEDVSTATLNTDGRNLTVVVNDNTNQWTTPTYTLTYDSSAGGSLMGSWRYNSGTPDLHPAFNLYHYSTYPTALSASASAPSLTYTIAAGDGSTQEDLIAASAKTINTTQADATANLTFRHLLAQVNFAVVGLKGYKVSVKNIKVKDILNSGTYTFSSADAGNTAAPGYPGSWSPNTGTADYTYTLSSTPNIDGVIATASNSTPATELLRTNDNALMLMPQTFSTTPTGGYFEFDYELEYNTSGSNYVPFDSGSVKVPLGTTGLSTTEWKAGYRYVYTIYFESPIIIKYMVTEVTDWQNPVDVPVDVDNNGNGDETTGEPGDNGQVPGNEFGPGGSVVTP